MFQALGENVSVRFYAPNTANYDINLLFIWLTAIFTVTLGSYWSGNVRYQLLVLSSVTFSTITSNIYTKVYLVGIFILYLFRTLINVTDILPKLTFISKKYSVFMHSVFSST